MLEAHHKVGSGRCFNWHCRIKHACNKRAVNAQKPLLTALVRVGQCRMTVQSHDKGATALDCTAQQGRHLSTSKRFVALTS